VIIITLCANFSGLNVNVIEGCTRLCGTESYWPVCSRDCNGDADFCAGRWKLGLCDSRLWVSIEWYCGFIHHVSLHSLCHSQNVRSVLVHWTQGHDEDSTVVLAVCRLDSAAWSVGPDLTVFVIPLKSQLRMRRVYCAWCSNSRAYIHSQFAGRSSMLHADWLDARSWWPLKGPLQASDWLAAGPSYCGCQDSGSSFRGLVKGRFVLWLWEGQ
jgi:hypothetical protein